ncbi:MAG: MBL fold metallo-hydrolase [Candidatus Omnitrophota bacterium]|nr:MBL fold metallo-hydrolase [Candidatus Omnitrophota bacterium]
MKITFLGTNGWYDTVTGNTPSVFIETKTAYIILDAGFGLHKAKELIGSGKNVLIFLSHFHLDHVIGLHTLPMFKVSQGIDIYVPRGGEKILGALLRRPFSSPPLLLATKIRLHDYTKRAKLPFEFEYARLRHSVPCNGFRFKLEGAAIVYCTDTGICNNLKRLARSADLLITECAMSPGDRSLNIFHITPETAARVAKEAEAKELALFHFDPGKYPTIGHRKAAEAAAKTIFPETIAANDGTVITF